MTTEALAPPPARFYVLTVSETPSPVMVEAIQESWKDRLGDVPLIIIGGGATLTADPHAEALALLREIVEATDAGSDTYEIRETVAKARSLLGMHKPW